MEISEKSLEKIKKAVDAALHRIEKDKTLDLEYIDRYLGKLLENAMRDSGVRNSIEKRHEINSGENNEKTVLAIHYTSIHALVSMIQNVANGNKKDSLRLYDSIHLNDPDEGNYIGRYLPQKYNWLKRKEASHAYITSFITYNDEKDMSDNLVFWRTYGREGKGCSLSLLIPRNRLKKVLYDKDGEDGVRTTIELLNPILDSLQPLAEIKSPVADKILSRLCETVWKSLERFRYLYKSEAYEYEKECRIVVAEPDITDEEKICFESGDQNDSSEQIRHYYVDEDLATENLLTTGSSITLGPCIYNSYNVKYYLETLLKKAGLHGPEIRTSIIPYRKF